MRELDKSEGKVVTKDVIMEALATVALQNGKPSDPTTIENMAKTLLQGKDELPRDQMRAALDGFGELLEMELEQP